MLQLIANSWNDRLLRLAFLCNTMMGVAVAALTPFLSVIGIERLGFSNASYALIATAGALISVAASISVGIYTDQTGRYRAGLITSILSGLFACSAMFLLPAKATFVLAHIVLFPISATAFTQYFAMASLASANNPSLDKDVSLSMIRAAFAASFGLTPPLLGIAVAAGMDLLTIYAVAALINLIVLSLVLTQWPGDAAVAQERSGISFFAGLKELGAPPVLIRLMLVAVIIGVNALYNILLGLLVLNALGGTEADVGWFAGGVALTEAPIMLASAYFLRHVTRSGLMLIGIFVYAIFLAALGLMPSMDAAWVLIIPGGIGAGIVLAITVGYVQELVSHRPGAGSSLVAVSHFTGTMFAAAVFAGATAVTGYVGTALIGCALGLAAGVTLFVLDGGKLRRSQPA